MNHQQDKADAISWARRLAERQFLVLDTETTGLYDAQALQIAVINQDGEPMWETLVMPTCEISEGAWKIHGISMDTLIAAQAPTFDRVYPELAALLTGQNLVIYNAAYDWPILSRQCLEYNLQSPELGCLTCAMEWYAQYVGCWNQRHQSYTWQKLPDGDHSALGDCQATLALIRRMAATPDGWRIKELDR